MNASDLPITRPCPYRVCELTFDAKGNCTACGLQVVDVSAGTPEQARKLRASKVRACVAYAVDSAGNVLFGRAALTASLVAAAGAALTLASRLEPVRTPDAPSVVFAEPVADPIPEAVPTPPPPRHNPPPTHVFEHPMHTGGTDRTGGIPELTEPPPPPPPVQPPPPQPDLDVRLIAGMMAPPELFDDQG